MRLSSMGLEEHNADDAFAYGTIKTEIPLGVTIVLLDVQFCDRSKCVGFIRFTMLKSHAVCQLESMLLFEVTHNSS